ncbi:TIGD4 [Cordylochernes scorpioides]|uniref:TIGD4 n=1 Tax=Cordylochernes scorpioides TaxID=51811 RepID=A0ABY6KL94_9ARAC|nr:TIGD4 [Cordylochernes scorpioides]
MAGERKQTRNSLSLSVKLQILREIEVEKKKKTDVAQKHNIPQSSLSTIIKNSEKIHQQALHAGESSRKRARGSTYADVDEALLQWFKQARSAALPVNGPLLSEKAKTLGLEFGLKDFTGSGGWIERWKARHGIKLRNICGESADVNRETMTNWLTDVMPNIISNYACKDNFNADETGLFWRLLPDKTLRQEDGWTTSTNYPPAGQLRRSSPRHAGPHKYSYSILAAKYHFNAATMRPRHYSHIIVHIPHPKEVLESIQTLRLFLQCQDESKSLHRHLSDLGNIEKSVQHLLLTSKCQKKITNYFSKTSDEAVIDLCVALLS